MAVDGGYISGSIFLITRCKEYLLLNLFRLSDRKGLQPLVCVLIHNGS